MRQLIAFKCFTRLGHSAGIVNQLKRGRLPAVEILALRLTLQIRPSGAIFERALLPEVFQGNDLSLSRARKP